MSFFSFSKKNVDYFIAISVFLQPVLVLLQCLMIDVLMMDPEATTIYRVMLSAIPMSLAILFSFKRKPLIFIITYTIVLSIIVIHSFIFPQNLEFIKTEGLRFLLPMVIPSALCLSSVNSLKIVENSLYYTSCVALFLVFLYVLVYFLGVFFIETYNMSFSYACLLPMVSFYRRRTFCGYIFALFLLISVLAIGSRGAAIVFVVYVFYDIFQYKIKYSFLLSGILLIVFLMLPLLSEWLDSVGIHSRTLTLWVEGEINQDSGRGDLYDMFYKILYEHPFWGIGLFGDRVYLDGFYCHNILLEMLLNWGMLGVILLWPLILILLLLIFLKCDKEYQNRIICYTLVLIGPLMASNSYLISPNFGIYCGIIYLIFKNNSSQSTSKGIQCN